MFIFQRNICKTQNFNREIRVILLTYKMNGQIRKFENLS